MSPNSGMLRSKLTKNINISAGYQYFCTKPSEQGSFFRAGQNESKQWYATIKTYKKHKYLSMISIFLHKTFRNGLIFLNQSKWVQTVVCYDQNLQKHKYLSTISIFLHKIFRTGLNLMSQLKWVQTVVCYDQNLQKHKYLSIISMLLYETFRTGLVFLTWSKWVQTVVCYDQNFQKHIYLSMISIFLHETFRTGLIFLSWSKWVQTVVCYDQNLQKTSISQQDINISAQNLQNSARFSELVKMSPNSGMLQSKLTKNINISAWYQYFCTKPSEMGSFFWTSRN